MKAIVVVFVVGVCAAAVLTACADAPIDQGPGLTSQAPASGALPMPTPTAVQVDPAEPQSAGDAAAAPTEPSMDAYVERATIILAAELNITPDLIDFEGIEPIDWPDPSLGCPLQGINYPSKVTPGYLVTLSAAGVEYAVHMSLDGAAVVCSADGTPMPASIPILPGEKILDGKPWVPVD